jgi:hypothetical protein
MTVYSPPVENTYSSGYVQPAFPSIGNKEQKTVVLELAESPASKINITITIDMDKTVHTKQKQYFQYHEIIQAHSWVKTLLQEPMETADPKGLSACYKKIQTLVREHDYAACSFIFNHLDIKKTNETLLIGLLRLTNPWKHKIVSWHVFLQQVHQELSNRGHTSAQLLRGLS